MGVLIVVLTPAPRRESGLAEIVRAGVVGRHGQLGAALGVAAIANVALAVLLSLGVGLMGLDGTSWSGALPYGAAHAAVGFVFAGVAAVTAQVTEHSPGSSEIPGIPSGLSDCHVAVAHQPGPHRSGR